MDKSRNLALYTRLKNTIMTSHEANNIARQIRDAVACGTVTYYELGTSEASFEGLVLDAGRRLHEMCSYLDRTRFM